MIFMMQWKQLQYVNWNNSSKDEIVNKKTRGFTKTYNMATARIKTIDKRHQAIEKIVCKCNLPRYHTYLYTPVEEYS